MELVLALGIGILTGSGVWLRTVAVFRSWLPFSGSVSTTTDALAPGCRSPTAHSISPPPRPPELHASLIDRTGADGVTAMCVLNATSGPLFETVTVYRTGAYTVRPPTAACCASGDDWVTARSALPPSPGRIAAPASKSGRRFITAQRTSRLCNRHRG